MNQQELFRNVSEAGLSGGFAIGARLPRIKGQLKGFNIITLEAIKNEPPTKFLNRIIAALGEKPLRNLEARMRRLAELVKTTTGDKRKFILIVNSAESLHQSIIQTLKKFHELDHNDNIYPGIVLLGDVDKIKESVKKNRSVALRLQFF
ncbi:MAG: hypothetical protein CVU54_02070 [Deltaproteobacteria bacterium HGW-Deltaproteobacteria-12]|jgi:hypothetical protein|nr:MAG: hypothetical protein CVU54_02070 [Deltaproteobacteria bacterium HGW-Deltaproteobacteria-12]